MVASYVCPAREGSTGWGSLHRRFPVGGAAKGTPRNTHTLSSPSTAEDGVVRLYRAPWRYPDDVEIIRVSVGSSFHPGVVIGNLCVASHCSTIIVNVTTIIIIIVVIIIVIIVVVVTRTIV